jgi:hypothetical protein
MYIELYLPTKEANHDDIFVSSLNFTLFRSVFLVTERVR